MSENLGKLIPFSTASWHVLFFYIGRASGVEHEDKVSFKKMNKVQTGKGGKFKKTLKLFA